MSQLLTLSRAARLIGVTRAELQQRIKAGALASFDGMVATEDLLRLYPQAQLEDQGLFERMAMIRDEAFGKRVRERALPSPQVLAERLYTQGRELADLRAHLSRYHTLVVELRGRMEALAGTSPADAGTALSDLGKYLDAGLERVLAESPAPDAIAVMDDMLRVMSAHVVLHPSRHEFFVDGSETLLEAAVRAGIPVNFGCSAGNCGLCKARVASGQAHKTRNHDYGLSEAEKQQGYILLCSNTAVSDMVLEALEASGPADIPEQNIAAKVRSVEPLSDHMLLLHLQTPRSSRLRFLAGQSVSLGSSAAGEAVLPIASCPCDDRNLLFHVDREGAGGFAERLFAGALRAGDTMTVRGPWGDFVLKEGRDRPLLFLACDAGFAPVKSLVEHAMAADEAERIHLYRLATRPDGHYLANVCRAWAHALDNFRYTPLSAERSHDSWEPPAEQLMTRLAEDYADLHRFDVFVAGPQGFVGACAKRLALRGVGEDRLSACVV
ncbi:MAG TPA: 2Fe-2S iron-sulfur cluster-binding protein [Burkholderiales bacterium]|nr:2Fe-2S iron-sulfur cluster-binding protein [Burkholderiales bacterium]